MAARITGALLRPPELALVSALWCRSCFGETEAGEPIPLNDLDWARLTAHARRAKDESLTWLEMTDIYGTLAQQERFRSAFAAELHATWRDGVRSVLNAYIRQ